MDFNARAISSICEPDGSSTSYSQTSQGYSTPLTPASSATTLYEHPNPDVQAKSLDDSFCDDVAPAIDPLARPGIQSQTNLYRNGSNPQQVHRRNAATWAPTTQLQTAVAGAMPSNFQTANSGSVVSHERRSFNMDLIDPIIESTLNTLVENIVGTNNWSTITKGRRLYQSDRSIIATHRVFKPWRHHPP